MEKNMEIPSLPKGSRFPTRSPRHLPIPSPQHGGGSRPGAAQDDPAAGAGTGRRGFLGALATGVHPGAATGESSRECGRWLYSHSFPQWVGKATFP